MSIPRISSTFAWCSLSLVILGAGAAAGATHHVGAGDLIADALAAAVAGDSVVVDCGTYTENGLVMPDGVVLRSAAGDPDCVTIATVGGASILTCISNGSATRIEGLTLAVAAGGLTEPVNRGAGIFCAGSAPSVAHCRFVGLEADYGGAIYCGNGAAPTIFACEFVANRARSVGGGLNCVDGSRPFIVFCLFEENTDAVHAANGSMPQLLSCTFVNCSGALSGWDGGAPTVTNSIIAAGSEPWTGDIGSVPAFTCTDIWGNDADWTGLLAQQGSTSGNLSANPYFCGEGTPDAPWSIDAASPCAAGGAPGCGAIGAFPVACNGVSGVLDQPDGPPHPLAGPTGLRGVHPNPFNPNAEVAFDLRRASRVELAVYDLSGRLVANLVSAVLPAGRHTASWAGRDRTGRAAATGVYLIRLDADGIIDTRRATLVK